VREITVKIHDVAVDGLPPRDGEPGYQESIGRVAFIFDGCIVSGWPLHQPEHPEFYSAEKIEQRAIGSRGGAQFTLAERRALAAGLHWVADEDVGHHRPFAGVTHWVEFPAPVWDIERGDA
jgi:hypothetical protein